MSGTPLADEVRAILSSDKVSGETVLGQRAEAVLLCIAQLEIAAASSGEAAAIINRRRAADKERKRRERGLSSDKKQAPNILSSATDSDSQKKERKRHPMQKIIGATGDLFGALPAVVDDWPEDYALQFWDAWPRHPRKHSQKQLFAKLAVVRKKQEATWAQVWGGLTAYLASNPEHKFIPCPLVWVNQARWMADYSRPTNQAPSAPPRGFGAVAFGRRG